PSSERTLGRIRRGHLQYAPSPCTGNFQTQKEPTSRESKTEFRKRFFAWTWQQTCSDPAFLAGGLSSSRFQNLAVNAINFLQVEIQAKEVVRPDGALLAHFARPGRILQ